MAEFDLSVLEKMNSSQYKEYHESFMQNNHGSTALHTSFSIFFTIQCSIYCSIDKPRSENQQCLLEFLVIVLPLIAVHTVLADYLIQLNLIVFGLLLLKYARNCSKINIVNSFREKNRFGSKHLYLVTIIRGLTYLITVFCILAVDFRCFPRYLAKTERFGYSLMDTGVGMFVLISGIVHKNLSKTGFLVFLGVVRFWSVKLLGYQEHVTEYGVHWNFFFTLAICKIISTLLLVYSNRALLWSILTVLVHEVSLWYGLQDWVFSDESRNTLLSANREGISSCLGYVSMYLFAAHLKTEFNNKNMTRYILFFRMIEKSVFFWTMSVVVSLYRPASRTLANAGYCLYLEATFLSISTFLYVFQVLFDDFHNDFYSSAPFILQLTNKFGFLYFLVGNLGTGMINLSMRTLLVSTSGAIAIFIIYMVVPFILGIFVVLFLFFFIAVLS